MNFKCECGREWPAERITVDTDSPMEEVNAARSRRHLPPFTEDMCLTEAAKKIAAWRATYKIHGHTRNDFEALPPGCTADAAGCGALTPDWGWQSCCMYEDYKTAGAAWVIGDDGLRYMQLFVRK